MIAEISVWGSLADWLYHATTNLPWQVPCAYHGVSDYWLVGNIPYDPVAVHSRQGEGGKKPQTLNPRGHRLKFELANWDMPGTLRWPSWPIGIKWPQIRFDKGINGVPPEDTLESVLLGAVVLQLGTPPWVGALPDVTPQGREPSSFRWGICHFESSLLRILKLAV